ncbi:MAG: hypothetical protein WC659_03435 [Patescibacteria group bacterium]
MLVKINLHGRLTIKDAVAQLLPHRHIYKLTSLDESVLIISRGTDADIDTLRAKGLEAEKVEGK